MLGTSPMCRNLIHTHHKHLFLTLNKIVQKYSFFVIFIICPLWRFRGISQLVSGLYHVTRDTGCNIHIGAKLYSLGRAKVFSSVATNFGLKTISPLSEQFSQKTTRNCSSCQQTNNKSTTCTFLLQSTSYFLSRNLAVHKRVAWCIMNFESIWKQV